MSDTIFCPQCGSEISEAVNYCPDCGTEQPNLKEGRTNQNESVDDKIEPSGDKNPSDQPDGGKTESQDGEISMGEADEEFYSERSPTEKAEATPDEAVRQVLYEDDEDVVGVLGRGYLDNIVSGGIVSRSTIILSNKRIYQKGVRYTKEDSEWIRREGSKVLSVEDVTGTSFTKSTNKKKIANTFGSSVLISGIVSLVIIFNSEIDGGLEAAFIIGFLLLLVSAIVGGGYWFAVSAFKNKLFVVDYAGGEIGTKIGWYSDEKVEKFRRKLFMQKR